MEIEQHRLLLCQDSLILVQTFHKTPTLSLNRHCKDCRELDTDLLLLFLHDLLLFMFHLPLQLDRYLPLHAGSYSIALVETSPGL
jgi:hypothetical protein